MLPSFYVPWVLCPQGPTFPRSILPHLTEKWKEKMLYSHFKSSICHVLYDCQVANLSCSQRQNKKVCILSLQWIYCCLKAMSVELKDWLAWSWFRGYFRTSAQRYLIEPLSGSDEGDHAVTTFNEKNYTPAVCGVTNTSWSTDFEPPTSRSRSRSAVTPLLS